jgi:NAD-reducing hydrogenase large subunit
MNNAVNQVAVREMSKKPEITEGMMNAVEVAIRAYDPCLSCATHALGQMPLEIALFDQNNKLIQKKRNV